MASVSELRQNFNRGIISNLGLARTDLKRTGLAAEIQDNFVPRVLGSMMLRPGLEYITPTYNNAKSVTIPFIFSRDDMADLEFSEYYLRVLIGDEAITRPSISTAITNGTFTSNVTGWTDADESGCTSQWATGGYLSLTGTLYNRAIRTQSVSVAAGDQNKQHALRIVVTRGSVFLRVGSTANGEEYISETTLTEGTHSLAFTPTGATVYLYIAASTRYASLVDSIAIESSGVMLLPTPYLAEDLYLIRSDQSADVVYLACDGYAQYKIERRGTYSWSFVKYLPEDGPFRTQNTSTKTLSASALYGDITLTSSAPIFKTGMEGALFRITSAWQGTDNNLAGDEQYGDYIKVTGPTAQRDFSIIITGTWVGTLTLERSISAPGAWSTVLTYTANTTTSYNDRLDNQIIYYRIGFRSGGYTSGTVNIAIGYDSGSSTGVARITTIASSTSASAIVLKPFGGTGAYTDWAEGQWSDYRGYPTVPLLDQGRLGWYGRDKVVQSASDAYEGFDPDMEGDAAPINRSIGSGPVDKIHWAVALQRICLGGENAEHFVFSSALDEPITPTSFNIKQPSTYGSSAVNAVKKDTEALFADASGTRLMSIGYDGSYKGTEDLTILCPDVCLPSIVKIAVQRRPDTRVHVLLSDGTVALLIYNKLENVCGFSTVQTDGLIEDVWVKPGNIEDEVNYTVVHTIGASTLRYKERWSLETECTGQPAAYFADSHLRFTSLTETTTITGLSHLEGREVVVWGWNTLNPFTVTVKGTSQTVGKDLGTYTVSGGQITVSENITNACVGLGYDGIFYSTKIVGEWLTDVKRIQTLSLILENTHYQGLLFGTDATHLEKLPLVEDGRVTDEHTVWPHYDKVSFPVDSAFETDSRIYLKAFSPRPCNVLCAKMVVEGYAK